MIELATVVAAPSCGAFLSDFGATVLKIETPKGDPWRKEAITLAPKGSTFSNLFENANRGKKSIVLDLKSPTGLRNLLSLLDDADVFLTNVREMPLRRLGLSYDDLKAKYPSLIYAHLTAWGRSGKKRDDAGYDAGAFWAASGLQDITRASDGDVPSRYPGGIGDHTTGLALAAGIAMALFFRERTGAGQLVEASLLRTGTWVNAVPLMLASGDQGHRGARGQRRGRADYSNPTFNVYKTKDGRWIQLLGLDTARHLRSTLKALSLDHLLEQKEFDTLRNVLRNRRRLMASMREKFETQTLEAWEKILRSNDVWFTPMQNFEAVMESPQLLATGGVDFVPGVNHGLLATPVKLSAFAHRARGRAPELGADTDTFLADLKLKSRL